MSATDWHEDILSDALDEPINFTATYAVDSETPQVKNESAIFDIITLDLATTTGQPLVSGSILFNFAGSKYFDRGGSIYRDHNPLTDAATLSGEIDYAAGICILNGWSAGVANLEINAALAEKGGIPITTYIGRAPGAPLANGQFQLRGTGYDGVPFSASADSNGLIAEQFVTGRIDFSTGIFALTFGSRVYDSALSAEIKEKSGWYKAENVENGVIYMPFLVQPESLRFNVVQISFIPLDADILGLDSVRLPRDGRVPIFRVGDVAVIHNTQDLAVANPAVAGSTHDCGRTLLSYAKVFDAYGLIVPTDKYAVDLDAGTVTFSAPLNLTGFTQPLKIEHRIEDMSIITDVQLSGLLKLMRGVRHNYPAGQTYVSSALVIGDMQARVTNFFDQLSWTGQFSDTLIGSGNAASYNDVLYPVSVTNAGAIHERWVLVFTGGTAFNCYGEFSGLVGQGSTGSNFSPINQVNGQAYFTIDYRGFGSGWPVGAAIRFNTESANYPVWIARTTLQSNPSVYTDNFKLQIRGDSN